MSALNDFPDPRTTEINEGVIAVGGDLDAANLKLCYSMGIFPWPHEGYPLLWFCPEERGILEFSELYINRSLDKWIRRYEPRIKVTVNQAFSTVIVECQQQIRQGQKGSWITPEIIEAYTELSKQGHAISVECWLDDELISGIYGVRSKNYFSCESMFFKKSNASKYAFLKLVEHLQSLGFTWMDLQMVTDVSESFGGKYISREEFLDRI
ncbi:MAG: leucyl/phenylalanyl-tRNA--protein transferase [Bdellovibrionota bacterium]